MSTKQSKSHVGVTEAKQNHKQKSLDEEKQPTHTISKSKQSRKQERRKRKQERLAGKKARRRIFPIWLRIIVVLIVCVGALIGGLMVGYGILGDGEASDALKWETWQHIMDIVKKSE